NERGTARAPRGAPGRDAPRSDEDAEYPARRGATRTPDQRARRGCRAAPCPAPAGGAHSAGDGCGRHKETLRLPATSPTRTVRWTCPVRTTAAPCAAPPSAREGVARARCSPRRRHPTATQTRTRVPDSGRGWRSWATGRSFRPYRYQTLRAIPRRTRVPRSPIRRTDRRSNPRTPKSVASTSMVFAVTALHTAPANGLQPGQSGGTCDSSAADAAAARCPLFANAVVSSLPPRLENPVTRASPGSEKRVYVTGVG